MDSQRQGQKPAQPDVGRELPDALGEHVGGDQRRAAGEQLLAVESPVFQRRRPLGGLIDRH